MQADFLEAPRGGRQRRAQVRARGSTQKRTEEHSAPPPLSARVSQQARYRESIWEPTNLLENLLSNLLRHVNIGRVALHRSGTGTQ